MTAVMSIEAAHRARYAQAREALWGKPRIVNLVAEEKRNIEAYRRSEKERWERQQAEAKKREEEREKIRERILLDFPFRFKCR